MAMGSMVSSGILGPDGLPLPRSDSQFDTINNNWFEWKPQWVEGVWNPDNISIKQYEKMLIRDETVFSGMEFLTMSCLARLGEYVNKTSTKIEDYVRENLNQMRGNFLTNCREILTGLPFGFSCTEILWKSGNYGEERLKGLQTLHPDTITLDIETDGPNKNELKTVWQFFRGLNAVQIEPEKIIHYRHRGFHGNLYGTSRLGTAFKPWFIKEQILKAWGIAAERFGVPYMWAKVKPGYVNDANNRSTGISNMQFIGQMLDSMGRKGSMAFNKDILEELKIEYGPSGMGDIFHQLILYCNTMIYRAFGLPSLIADSGTTGSYSLGKQHYQLFVLVLEDILNELIDCLLEQLIRPLIEKKFGEQSDYGDFSAANLQADDELLIAETLVELEACGAIDRTRLDDLNYMRERIGLPLLTEDDILPAMPPVAGAGAPGDPTAVPLPPPNLTPTRQNIPEQQGINDEPRAFSWSARQRQRRDYVHSRRVGFSRRGLVSAI